MMVQKLLELGVSYNLVTEGETSPGNTQDNRRFVGFNDIKGERYIIKGMDYSTGTCCSWRLSSSTRTLTTTGKTLPRLQGGINVSNGRGIGRCLE